MTLKEAVRMLETEYEKAKRQAHIRKPLAYVLYQVWKLADREG